MNILIIGATSAIAQAVVKEYLNISERQEHHFMLMGRDEERLSQIKQDVDARQAKHVSIIVQDLAKVEQLEACIENIWAQQEVDIALVAHGTLPEQQDIQSSVAKTFAAFSVNALSYFAVMTALGNLMEKRGSGVIAVIGSVAGDRGRQSNYIYGSAKGAVALFAQGLRNRLFASGVHILTIKPGFVDTPMTAGIDKSGPLWATPEQVATTIVKAIQKKKNVVYVPGFWLLIMMVIKNIPEFIFKRLKL